MNYKAFLDIFLFSQSMETLNFRLMDIMESDIRKTAGNIDFKMDEQIYQLSADINVSSRYGYGCNIKRFYSYE